MKVIRPMTATIGSLLVLAASHAPADNVSQWLNDLQADDHETRVEAIDRLGLAGSTQPKVVEALTSQLDDPDAMVRAHAAVSLGRLGVKDEHAVDKLIEVATDPDGRVRRVALRALTRIGPPPEQFLPLLGKKLRDADPSVRVHALNALANIGKPAVPLLIEALQRDKDAFWACLVLAEIGPDAQAAVPELLRLVDHENPEVRREALLALAEIGEGSPETISKIAGLLEDPTPGVALGAAYVLGKIGPEAQSASDKLKQHVDAEDPIMQTVALWALARVNPNEKEWFRRAVPLLVERLTDNRQNVREAAVQALMDLNPPPGSLIPQLKKVLDQANAETVSRALDALATLGKPAVPRLIAAMEHDEVRMRAAMILGRIGPEAEEAIPALTEALKDPRSEVRREAVFALGAIGPAAAPAVPQITELLQDPDMNVRYAAAYALGKIGPKAIGAKQQLLDRLATADQFLALVSAWALAQIQPECSVTSPKTVPLLIKALDQSSPMVQLEAIDALECLGPLAEDALPRLKELAQSASNPTVRQAASDAAKEIEK